MVGREWDATQVEAVIVFAAPDDFGQRADRDERATSGLELKDTPVLDRSRSIDCGDTNRLQISALNLPFASIARLRALGHFDFVVVGANFKFFRSRFGVA